MRYAPLFLLLVLGCGIPTDSSPWRPPEAALVAPHPDSPRWWSEVQACVGLSGNFDRIQWFTVEGSAFSTPDHGWAGGRWVPPHDIYLAEARYDSEEVVKHEMVHELLRPGASDDPRFEDCSGIGH